MPVIIIVQNTHLGVCVLLMVRFMARLAKLESKSPVRTLLDEELAGLAGIAPVAPVFPDG